MPRVPTYQPNQIGSVETTNARLRPADNDGGVWGAIGEGMQTAGRAISQHAEFQDQLNAENDDTQARAMFSPASQEFSTVSAEFQTLQAGAAREAQEGTTQRLNDIRDRYLEQATNPRMRRMLEERLTGLFDATNAQIARHAIQQQRIERTGVFKSQESSFAELAVSAADPALGDEFMADGLAVIQERLEFEGIDPGLNPERYHMEALGFTSAVHGRRVDTFFAETDPPVNKILAYVEAYGDEMTADLRASTMARLQSPLQGRQSRGDADGVLTEYASGVEASQVSQPGPGPADQAAGAGNLDRITAQTESGNRDYRADGRPVTSPVGARFAMQVMPATARDPGFGLRPADPNNADDMNRLGREYRAVMEQRYGGDLSKMWAAYNAGPGAVDEAMRKHGNDWFAHMPRETRDYVAKNLQALGDDAPAGGAPFANAPREWDRARVEAIINDRAEREGWSPERTERARREVDTRIARDERLLQDQRAAADEAAATIVARQGENFRVSQIPRAVWVDLSPRQQAEFQEIERKAREPKPIAAGGARAIELTLMRTYEPDKFMALNLGKEVGSMTASEISSIAESQAKMRVGIQEREGAFSPRSGIVTAITFGKSRDPELDLSKEDEAAIIRIMEIEASEMFRRNGSKPLSENDYAALFRSATRSVRTQTSFLGIRTGGRDRGRYELTLSMMPDDQRDRLTQRFQSEVGRLPTDAELLRLYRADQR